MAKQLFFDDNKLFGLDNTVRKQGKPELAAVYSDEACSTDYCTGYVFKLENGKYRMLYMAHGQNFTEYRYCLNVDVNDDKLAELYGMYAFEYDGMYIGVPHLYRHLKSEFNTKYKNGIIDTQLAYSYDGRYWTRGIREPFISGINPDADTQYNLMWVSNMIKSADGNLYFYAAASEAEHGMAFEKPGTGKMHIYRLRNDGFVSLVSEDKDKTASVITREKVWHSGELHLNLKAKKATVGVYVTEESEMVESNLLGNATPLEGYGHEDCIEFSGDSTDWIPQYKTGKKLDELKGKTLVFELRFNDGEVFSLSDDYTDVFNVPAARYRKFGVLPE